MGADAFHSAPIREWATEFEFVGPDLGRGLIPSANSDYNTTTTIRPQQAKALRSSPFPLLTSLPQP